MENTLSRGNQKINSFFRAIWKGLRNPTFLYIVRRILSSLLTLVLLVALVTTLIHMLPDNKFVSDSEYSSMIAKYGQTIADNWRKTVLFKYGRVDLNGNRIPLIQSILQYIYYILPIYKEIPITWNNRYTKVIKYWTGFVYLGRSMTSSAFVLDEFVARVPISFQVTMLALLLTYIIAYPLGIAMAKKPGGVVDKIGNVFIVLNYAIPALVFYLFMNIVFGDPNGIFGWAKFGYYYNANNPSFWNLVPPILCMSFLAIPGVIIWLRRFMVDELNSDYVKFARSKGLSENKIMYTHVLRNAIVPLVRNIPATFIGAIVGSYFVEKIWSIPGTGSLFTDGLQALDVPVIQGLCVLYSAMSMLAFLLGDIITIFFDPRIKLQGE